MDFTKEEDFLGSYTVKVPQLNQETGRFIVSAVFRIL
jgi:hypothetical protein